MFTYVNSGYYFHCLKHLVVSCCGVHLYISSVKYPDKKSYVIFLMFLEKYVIQLQAMNFGSQYVYNTIYIIIVIWIVH